ncbi:MAG: sodium:proton antiporter [Alistipes sp.]|nr:sodium:proton antiporter [Alistipes sp.]
MAKLRKNRVFRQPAAWVSAIPMAVLVAMLALVIKCFGSDAIMGGSQVALLSAASVCVMIAIGIYGCSWSRLEEAILDNIHTSASSIIILLLIGAIAGTWMVSGVVPTLIYYGLKVLHPSIFLVATCAICALVSLITGSSWTTIATIGVALMGIGRALGFADGWIAGAIISGAYFGDKVSMLSDTTVLASSTAKVPIFTHINYMMQTTIPSFVVAIVVFAVAGLLYPHTDANHAIAVAESINNTFNITAWLLLVPLFTGVLIARKLPAIVTLFLSCVMACVALVVAQPAILAEIAGVEHLDFMSGFKGVLTSCYGATAIDTGSAELNGLVATRGMAGMLETIWLIVCAMCFGGVMTGSGMLASITDIFLRLVRRASSAVASTVGAGLFFNVCTADQYISIILTGNLFRDLYKQRGFEPRLLSRSVEDSATVCSVLVPWNSCGMTQATVLGVSTFTYLPYCIFNLVSPLMSILITSLFYKKSKKEA